MQSQPQQEQKKKKKTGLLYFLLFAFGLIILLYPFVSSQWNAYRDRQLISEYKEEIANTKDKDLQEAWDAAVAYNKELGIQPVPDAFSLRDGISDPKYESVLNLKKDGLMGYVEIPKINIELPLYHYTTDSVLQKGAGHLFGSALPVGGEGTHAVASAHRGLPSAEMFTNLPELKKGDVFYYHILGEVVAYEVDQILTVKPHQVESLSGVEGKDYSTLVTCTPYGVNTDRILVRGRRIPYDKKQHKKARETRSNVQQVQFLTQIVCAFLGILVSVLIVYLLGKLKKKKNEKKEEN